MVVLVQQRLSIIFIKSKEGWCDKSHTLGGGGGEFLGLQLPPPPPPPPKMVRVKSYSIECSVIDVPSHGRALIYRDTVLCRSVV